MNSLWNLALGYTCTDFESIKLLFLSSFFLPTPNRCQDVKRGVDVMTRRKPDPLLCFSQLQYPLLKMIWLMLIVFFLLCGSNENDITERLKNIIQSNAVLRQELEESSASLKFLV
jgi:hypothetical protein